ncbi:Mak10 subunit, NatC N-terminal acetyltransferase-domain-containing protein [Dichomitus squalens]|uniref:Mak10 subunit, NatC N-terminal acetyltransferase-domain-containing protein n=1 Tax=Dichomitus squalens TaxID=114155 RepID=A0A4Q9NIG5_9APHY|nr:Mak10 subunit, NatC N-terminal acetyltransferase-domain-containing protein [Dichomitus squalens]TBU57018.1 Mak10 subunit, NatC N-terminal acetyltransferase-domain-containing protein [Dichomitus squalens]
MPMHSGFEDYLDIPGGDDFAEVTDLFVAGAQDMEPEEVLLMDGFTLMDAMSAFEIGEPRLDSGMILEEQRRPPFDPLTPLLPEEVCWILDRSFACEMEWHAGKTLSQSVFTILFVHHLPDINPEYLPPEEDEDPARPRWLITVVIRAAMLGLLKCCDFAWRELSKNRVHDIEDWQGEKCDVSLLEGVNSDLIMHLLDTASDWVQQSDLSDAQIDALCDRLYLRKTLLALYKLDLLKGVDQLWYHTTVGRELIDRMRTPDNPIPPDSSVHLAMDAYIARRLPNFMPIRITEIPPLGQIWDSLDAFLEFWAEIGHLVASPSLSLWKTAGQLRYSLHKRPACAFHRSLLQTLFFDKELVFGTYRPTRLVEQFFYETIGIPYPAITQAFKRSGPANPPASMQDVVERRIIRLMVPHIRSYWYNPPRRRRHLMKEVLQWHMLYDVMLKDVETHEPPDAETAAILRAVPLTARIWRLEQCREVILAGFQQELYAPEERPIAYWYLARVLDQHIACIEDVLPSVARDSGAYSELSFQADHLAALQMISTALIALTSMYITSTWKRISINFKRRYKWVLDPEFKTLTPAHPLPDLLSFPSMLDELLQDTLYSPSRTFELAENIAHRLSESPQEAVSHWDRDRRQYLRNLADACDRLKRGTPDSLIELPNLNVKTLKWIPDVHPWFPTVASA